ncbi:hypothetical protein BDW22DRAFT_924979 [Trametopsis cervina]|nr:hypothetical protein BDW22DRAFT_924979 [Trametopsis cervina]
MSAPRGRKRGVPGCTASASEASAAPGFEDGRARCGQDWRAVTGRGWVTLWPRVADCRISGFQGRKLVCKGDHGRGELLFAAQTGGRRTAGSSCL